ncbi:MAG: hypothetical protein COW18_09740 [Zetaproteobacteria bacterium CG12_big_fil_rev_8_21_14_0_65_54_13]|nr:MAG: hypothetical protein COX55_00290 [Zetaproteobacteria bacterium CG23_combo_of_CG06-09_8_20_14_all_54_7]PIW47040.1 MAG: hypothetical protein COW18_09740 [Zetaproteobacteria bacterium CG12_big_fil_rev_8_21_14_0_65_54_13]PIX53879.1 MAG: hypothetical protein COZ50_10920 [Zetaproteobacteria bacterium CG_4_10_14_3_um_filter_54_28]PJA28598.1 MAG: hypothetical protein CO188_08965 [Zetaproteobacteria bacterium CG_4_9_14_3_um_filter_54_145]
MRSFHIGKESYLLYNHFSGIANNLLCRFYRRFTMENNAQDKTRLAEQYDKLASKFKELYLAGKERGREPMSVALDEAREQLTALGEFSAEHGEELKQYLARDLDQTILDAQHLGEEAKERLNPARLGAGALSSLATALELTSNALHSLSVKTKNTLAYKTGEMTSAGTLICKACGQNIHLKGTGHVPPCPKCNGTLFNRGY